ncbi:MAG TPA: YfiR family protein [Stellaceae bacterium]|nr:YfiR family protein [Stellaceae bacterium]
MPRWARKIGGVAAALLLGLAASPSWGQAGGLAIAVKATYLVKFGSFVVWPAEAFPAPTSPFTICTAGTDGFGDLIDRAAAGQIVGDHRITVRHGFAPDCQILYVGGDASLLDAVANRPVLTVTDLPDSAPRKGIVNFVVQENHVRFEIDDRAAAESGLRISSQLMTLAVRARGRQ